MTAVDKITITVGRHVHDALAAGPVDGEFVLLLHGWPEFADCWTEQLHALAEAGYRAVAVDQRGYSPGARPGKITDYAVQHLVDDALAFAESQGAHRFHLIAHDWGGMVAWALASAHPQRLRSLAVLATPHPVALQQASAADQEQYHRLDYVRFFRQPGGVAEASLLGEGAARLRAAYGGKVPAELVEHNVRRLSQPGALSATLNWYRAVDEDFTVPAGQITVPTLYIWGSGDMALGRDAAHRTAGFVDAPYRFEILDGASHWLPEEVPDQVIPMLLEHLKSV
ncbi:alpha/beta hydrolase [Kutzneria viridogrisea]|uniref:Alpha/beta hydrolase n=2 Tax=Kutzneria TaxID=43356 RepID=W5WEB1_9PSEU|nr:alpha/beta hydrolase [Kutzneria albida]AHH96514.1 alpha/beta hydrolase [Kutzneria albida DSM 43870]MBA8928268.1 pimeloyl-ACP methyl ester carboxylesterase [Kutzneria viridogrisea]